MEELARSVDRAKWGGAHSMIFASTSLGFFIWGLESELGILYYVTLHSLAFLVAFYAMDFVGDLLVPRLSDTRLARKGAFYLTMTLMGVGLTVLAVDLAVTRGVGPAALPTAIAGAFVAKIGIEGDVPVSLSFLAENTPAADREFSLIMAPNFNNLGSAVGAVIAMVTYYLTNSTMYMALSVAAAAIAALAVLAAVRVSMPESVRWLLARGFRERAEGEARRLAAEARAGFEPREVTPTVGLLGRYAFLVALGVSQYITFGLMAFVIAAFYYQSQPLVLAWITFVATMGASVAAVPAYLLAKRMDSRDFALLSYLGGLVTMIPIVLFVLYFPTDMALFYALLFVNMVFSEFSWAVRTVLEPMLFPTEVRATMIGLVRAVPMAVYDVSSYLTSSFTELQFVWYNAAFWALGAAATAVWRLVGYDVRGALLESASRRPGLRGLPSPSAAPA